MPREQKNETESYPLDDRNRVKRRHQRGFYDKKTVFEILDSGLLCHISYVIDGQPYCTPTSYWREGDYIYWHGSSASRMVDTQSKQGLPVCLTVTHLDSLNLARSGFNHSINYRCVFAFGNAEAVPDDRKRVLLDRFINRIYPGRAALLREPTVHEMKATSLVSMHIDQASAKIRDILFGDDEADFALPTWTAVMPVSMVLGDVIECTRLAEGVVKPKEMEIFQPGRTLDEISTEAYGMTFGSTKWSVRELKRPGCSGGSCL